MSETQNVIPYGRQYVTEADIEAVTRVLRSDYLTQGPELDRFEIAFAKYVGSEFAVAVANGTAALHLCAIAMDIGPGDRVLTTPITFAASANCVRYCGGAVDFVEIDPETALIDLDALRWKLENVPRGTYCGVIPVDFAGYPVDTEKVRELADEFGLWIIEDACHAPGGSFSNSAGESVHCGSGRYAELAIFSFHPVKHIACGEGGMITTNDPALYDRLRSLRTHGITKDPARIAEGQGGWYYEMQELGFNYRQSELHAALGYSQLQRAQVGLRRRQKFAQGYDEAFAGTAVRPVRPAGGVDHAYHLYVVRVPNRRAVYDHLRSKSIYAQVHYIPVHLLPYYREQGFAAGMFPRAEALYAECLSLPLYPSMRETDQARVVAEVLAAVGK